MKIWQLIISTGMLATLIATGTAISGSSIAIAKPYFPAPTKPLSWAIDFYTDHFFYAANPELEQRKLRSSDRTYIQEWYAIRRAVAPLIVPSQDVCEDIGANEGLWEVKLKSDGDSTYNSLADAIFYHRNPQYRGKKLMPNTTVAAQWSAIRSEMLVNTCGL